MGIGAGVESQPVSSDASASAGSPGSPSGRPKTSRRVRNPTPSEFNDYVVPSPQRQATAPVSQTLSFDAPKGVVKPPVAFRSNRPEPLEDHVSESPDSGDHGVGSGLLSRDLFCLCVDRVYLNSAQRRHERFPIHHRQSSRIM
jgi:hypothetical protein